MPQFRISQAASLLGVSDDTVRRWVEDGQLDARTDDAGRKVVEGAELARYAQELAERRQLPEVGGVSSSARNHFTGLVTRVQADGVMAQVDLQCGPFRVVSLMSAEAARDLGLEAGSLASAVVKATTVIVQAPRVEP
ncbi:helix-turn-helix domain-containing protein [Georgenia sp. 311]|uniref:Helix-turn-helix domain-containing protein n=1 Tax=Georgenia wutianyii TaxID=2585135 RepID=A0ABX5VN09_9MICO|nr:MULTISPECIES: helix-turn-helix transcriptional regulator [Georgenia]QDB78215.1 helix-turn-helix domain-containing protein [Georgenia wutianyii]TNC16886.1 helix-turn-helix domain-containing protein [Georgenia sp. 311]